MGYSLCRGCCKCFVLGQPIPPQSAPATPAHAHAVSAFARHARLAFLAGCLPACSPVVSGGIGGLLAGHATSKYDDRLFLISQGASKVAYYIGSTLLLFVPGVALVRGGMSWMLSSLYVPYGPHLYWLVIASIAVCGAASLVVLVGLVRVTSRLVSRINPKAMAVVSILIAAAVAFGFTGINGLLVMGVATCIGCIPVFVGGRRMNCLGIILLPITLNVIGVGADVAKWLGLL
ncbi:MAG: hypothetical protein HC853_08550 [Anaerolineae bacterium]|nr:hypothetical protein [Anaerolineae bacterium]